MKRVAKVLWSKVDQLMTWTVRYIREGEIDFDPERSDVQKTLPITTLRAIYDWLTAHMMCEPAQWEMLISALEEYSASELSLVVNDPNGWLDGQFEHLEEQGGAA